MDDIIKTKLIISLLEGFLFIILIISSLITMFDILSTDFVDYSQVFQLLSLRIVIISSLLFLFLPRIILYCKNISGRAMVKYNQNRLKNQFYTELKENDVREINILQYAHKFDVNLMYFKNYLRDQISEGLLKGELKGDVFYIEEGFKLLDIKERRLEFMKKNIGRFISPHRWIKIREISNNFKVPKNITILFMKQLINEGILKGYIEGETFIRDLSLQSEVKCPYCNKEIDLRKNEEL